MAGFGKAIIIAMLAVSALIMLLNLAFFFPWYLTLVEKGFALSQIVATNNYLPYEDYDRIIEELRDLPVFRERNDDTQLWIEVVHYNGDDAIESYDHHEPEYYYTKDESEKPYVQMGHQAMITLHACYPFRTNTMGGPIFDDLTTRGVLGDINVSFSLTTTTTKHYKDLEYDYIIDEDAPVIGADYETLDEWDKF